MIQTLTLDAAELVKSAQDGDEQAFEQLINISISKLKSMLASHFRLQAADLEDIIQTATVKAFRKIDRFRNESSFSTWLYIILKNEAYSYIKKKKLIDSFEIQNLQSFDKDEEFATASIDEIYEETAASVLEKKEMLVVYRQLIEQVLNDLTAHHREVIELSLQQELPYKDIAEKLGIPIGTVMSRLFFARKHAKDLIIKYARLNSIQLDCVGGRDEDSVS